VLAVIVAIVNSLKDAFEDRYMIPPIGMRKMNLQSASSVSLVPP